MNLEIFLSNYQKVKVTLYKHQVIDKSVVSVCVVAFQHAKFIRQCLDGILMQETDFAFEILLGEDDSTDGTREICIEYAEKYPAKIKLFLHSRTNNIAIEGHPTGRFNFVYNLLSARGKYIALCEGDDYWTDPNKLQKQVDFLEKNHEYTISFHNCKVKNSNGELVSSSLLPNESQRTLNQVELMSDAWLPTLSVVFRKPLDSMFTLDFFKVVNADTFLWSLLGKYGNANFDNTLSGVHIRHLGGIWSMKDDIYKLESSKHTLRLIANHVENNNAKYKLFRKITGYNSRLLRRYVKTGNFLRISITLISLIHYQMRILFFKKVI